MRIPDAQAAVDKWWAKQDNFPAWQVTIVRSNNEVIKEAQANGKKVHFPTLVDLGHLQNWELHKKFQTYYGRVVLRGDSAKDDAGSFAVFTPQGASASQMSTAEILNTLSRLPGCTGRAGDAVSACTQEKLEDAPQLLRLPKTKVQWCGYGYNVRDARKVETTQMI